MRPPTKLQVFPNFLPKNGTIIITPRTLQIYLRQTIFCSPKLKLKLKGRHFADIAEIQETVNDELKKVQKEEFLTVFQKTYDCAKAHIYANGAYFEEEEGGRGGKREEGD